MLWFLFITVMSLVQILALKVDAGFSISVLVAGNLKYLIMKIKLEKLEIFMTLDKKESQVINARKQIANLIYSQGAGFGLAGQALAVKMWNGDDEIDYSSEEVSIITSIVEKTTAPCFIEAVNKAIEIGTNA